jgi:hypothetical protein
MKTETKTKTLYLLSDKISWKLFKHLQDKLVKGSGPDMVHLDEMLWKLNKEHKIYCWFASDVRDDMGIGFKLPKGYKIKVISDRKSR